MNRLVIAIISFLFIYTICFPVKGATAAQTETYVYQMQQADYVYKQMDRATNTTGSLPQNTIFFGQPVTASWLYVPNKKGYVPSAYTVRQKGIYSFIGKEIDMYKAATRSSKKVRSIKRDNVVIRYVDVMGGWTFASINGIFGYVPTNVLQAPKQIKTIVYAKDGAALRSAPTKSAQPVTIIPAETAVTIYNSFAGWSFIAGAGYSGYVLTSAVTKATTVPSKQATTKAIKGKKIALTFDDGPHRTVTPQILDTLKKYHVKATFYVLGQEAERNATLLKRIAREGHVIGNHSWSHKNLSKMSIASVNEDLQKTNAVIARIAGITPTTYRPPYGAITQKMRTSISMKPMLWTVDTLDWQHRNASKTLAAVQKSAKSGGVILMHDIHQPTADALARVITYLQQQGYTFVTVDEL